jgi:hypothetical protein
MASKFVTHQMGTHQISVEDDIVFLQQNGDYTPDDALKTHAEIEGVLYSLGRVFILVDQSKAGITQPQTRKIIAAWNKKHKATGAAMFGGGLASRAAATLVLSAIRLFRPDLLPTVFVETEAEGRAWINAQRNKYMAKTGAQPRL